MYSHKNTFTLKQLIINNLAVNCQASGLALDTCKQVLQCLIYCKQL